MDTTKQGQKKYQKMVEEVSPNSDTLKNCLKAFFSGGSICLFGQSLIHFFRNEGIATDDAALYTSIVLMLIAAVLTALGLFAKIAKVCGAGTLVPITGFANSVVSPALEFKKEGFIFGMAAKMFIVAGPVIVYGVLTSMLVGVVHYFFGTFL